MKSSRYFGKEYFFYTLAGFLLAFLLLLFFFVSSIIETYQYQMTALLGTLELTDSNAVDQLMNATLQPASYEKGLALLESRGYGASSPAIFFRFISGNTMCFFILALVLIAIGWMVMVGYYKNHRAYLAVALERVKAVWTKPDSVERPVYYGDADASALLDTIDRCAYIYRRSLLLVNAEKEKVYAFMEDVSHQLKTPLALMRIYLERMEMEHEGQMLKKTEQCLIQIDKMNSLIRHLLKIGKFDAGRVQMAFELHSALIFSESVIDDLVCMAEENEVRLELVCSEDLNFYFDDFWLREALENLIKNCIEHAPSDTAITVYISDAQRGWFIQVSDCGPGIQLDNLSSVFDRFHSASRQNDQSNGLGLTIAKQILQCHFGTLEVQNNADRGVTFTAHLPYITGKETYNT